MDKTVSIGWERVESLRVLFPQDVMLVQQRPFVVSSMDGGTQFGIHVLVVTEYICGQFGQVGRVEPKGVVDPEETGVVVVAPKLEQMALQASEQDLLEGGTQTYTCAVTQANNKIATAVMRIKLNLASTSGARDQRQRNQTRTQSPKMTPASRKC